jgi:RimJ/RimL family protein N-acetyltransferase
VTTDLTNSPRPAGADGSTSNEERRPEMLRAQTARLVIEPLTAAHAPLLFPALNDERVYRFLPERRPISVEALVERFTWLEQGAPPGLEQIWLNWAVGRRGDGAWLGTLQATVLPGTPNRPYAFVGYVLTPSVWGQGLGLEALRWLIDELASSFPLERLVATVDVRNTASIRLLERAGFIRLGAEAADLHGEPTTDFRYQRDYGPLAVTALGTSPGAAPR